jgi:hypothetical protein
VARGALRGAATAWLGLIALQVVTSGEGSGRLSEVFVWVNSLVTRALDPDVAAIPDLSSGEAWGPTAAAAAPAAAPSAGAIATPSYSHYNRVPVPTY